MIQFQEDHFRWDDERQDFYLAEPATLLADRLSRVQVQAHRVRQGWEPVFTVHTETDLGLGVIDIWTRQVPTDALEDPPPSPSAPGS